MDSLGVSNWVHANICTRFAPTVPVDDPTTSTSDVTDQKVQCATQERRQHRKFDSDVGFFCVQQWKLGRGWPKTTMVGKSGLWTFAHVNVCSGESRVCGQPPTTQSATASWHHQKMSEGPVLDQDCIRLLRPWIKNRYRRRMWHCDVIPMWKIKFKIPGGCHWVPTSWENNFVVYVRTMKEVAVAYQNFVRSGQNGQNFY